MLAAASNADVYTLQLHSSRSGRYLQQEIAQGRFRGGIVDHDPMDGLPVRRWELLDVTVKQDAKNEEQDDSSQPRPGVQSTWPWADLPLPKDLNLLPSHSQVSLRSEQCSSARQPY